MRRGKIQKEKRHINQEKNRNLEIYVAQGRKEQIIRENIMQFRRFRSTKHVLVFLLVSSINDTYHEGQRQFQLVLCYLNLTVSQLCKMVFEHPRNCPCQ